MFLKEKYTALAVLVLGILGSVWILFYAWLSRYRFYDWWRWKRRAWIRIGLYWLILCAAKYMIYKG